MMTSDCAQMKVQLVLIYSALTGFPINYRLHVVYIE